MEFSSQHEVGLLNRYQPGFTLHCLAIYSFLCGAVRG